MPPETCPHCALPVSPGDPTCFECGGPLPASASPHDAPPKPVTGIVTALVVGTMTILWVLQREPVPSGGMWGANAVMTAVLLLGNAALIVGALLSLGGERRAHAAIRALSKGMIAALAAWMLYGWWVGARAEAAAGSDVPPGFLAGLVLFTTLAVVAPWVLYLFLFRRSRYP